MKAIFACILWVAGPVSAAISSDGTGLFPVMVMAVDAKSSAPIEGFVVKLEELVPYHDYEFDPTKTSKNWEKIVGKPAISDNKGIATVIYQGRWSSFESGEKSTYGRSLRCTVVVAYKDKEIFRSTLEEWAKKNGYTPEACSVPLIIVEITTG